MNVCESVMGDAYAAYACALAYQLARGDKRREYAEKAVEILDAWGSANRGFKARAESYHRKQGWTKPFVRYQLVSSSYGVGLIFAAELMTDYDGWQESHRLRFKKWVNEVYRPEADGIRGFRNGSNWVC